MAIETPFSDPEHERRAALYAQLRSLELTNRKLGHGVHGTVWEAISQPECGSTVLKVFDASRKNAYVRERDVYLRLAEHQLVQICGHHIPQVLDFDDELLVIEMTMVKPPFVLDFGGAWLDVPPEFPAETLLEWEADKAEQFGDRWPDVKAILYAFRQYGIYISDVNPGNIRFCE